MQPRRNGFGDVVELGSEAAPQAEIPSISEAEAERRLGISRFDLAALLAKADHRFLAGDHRGASAFYTFAAKHFDGTTEPSARRAQAMRDWLADRFRQHILTGVEERFAPEDWPPRFRAALQIMFGERPRDLVTERFPQLPNLFFYPGLPYVDFADVALFPWRRDLEAGFGEIREEASALLAGGGDFTPYVRKATDYPQGDVHGLLENSDWSSLFLWNYGRPVEENAARCPRTFEIVNRTVPLCHIGRMGPAVLFSLLKPGAHIPPHSGMLNIQYICHLPLIVPPGCSFRVGETTRQWQEGRMLAFDDTVEHEARNDGASDRLILIFYVWNPFLGADEQRIIRHMLEVVEGYR